MMYPLEPASVCSLEAKASSRAFSSLNLMSPYSSTLSQSFGGGAVIDVLHDAVRVHDGSKPPRSTVAVIVCPPVPVVSTVILLVPCPLLMVPADTDQL